MFIRLLLLLRCLQLFQHYIVLLGVYNCNQPDAGR